MYYVYITTNKYNRVLYIGVTSNLANRIQQHKQKVFSGFTTKYNVNKLVYYDSFDHIHDALSVEKKLKNWRRQWKINLVTEYNQNWEEIEVLK